MFNWLVKNNVPVLIIATKADKISRGGSGKTGGADKKDARREGNRHSAVFLREECGQKRTFGSNLSDADGLNTKLLTF